MCHEAQSSRGLVHDYDAAFLAAVASQDVAAAEVQRLRKEWFLIEPAPQALPPKRIRSSLPHFPAARDVAESVSVCVREHTHMYTYAQFKYTYTTMCTLCVCFNIPVNTPKKIIVPLYVYEL